MVSFEKGFDMRIKFRRYTYEKVCNFRRFLLTSPFHRNHTRPLEETEKDHLDLTPREQELLTMLLTGLAPKEIAYTLKISNNTVNFHQKNLYRKLGIQSRAELFAKYSTIAEDKTG